MLTKTNPFAADRRLVGGFTPDLKGEFVLPFSGLNKPLSPADQLKFLKTFIGELEKGVVKLEAQAAEEKKNQIVKPVVEAKRQLEAASAALYDLTHSDKDIAPTTAFLIKETTENVNRAVDDLEAIIKQLK